jgi:hypothetical protein
VLLAPLQPEHAVVGEVVAHLEGQLAEARVDVRRGGVATSQNIAELRPDIVIVATGSEPNLPGRADDGGRQARNLSRQILPESEELDLSFVFSADEVLSGRRSLRQRRRHRRDGPLGGGGNR